MNRAETILKISKYFFGSAAHYGSNKQTRKAPLTILKYSFSFTQKFTSSIAIVYKKRSIYTNSTLFIYYTIEKSMRLF